MRRQDRVSVEADFLAQLHQYRERDMIGDLLEMIIGGNYNAISTYGEKIEKKQTSAIEWNMIGTY